jgi:CheY-like chemotaxis protein
MSQAICYFPTSILLLDDNKDFVDSLAGYYSSRKDIKFKGFTEIPKIKKYLKSSLSLKELLPAVKFNQSQYEHQVIEVSISIKEVYKLLESKNDNNIVSCIIVDLNMPEMDGLTFLRSLNTDSNAIKILLTGEADNGVAIKAFNEGLIDYYVSKGDVDFLSKLSNCIISGQEKYFIKCSKLIYDVLKLNSQNNTILGKPEFKKVFQDILNKHKITEYYLIEEIGSYILKDSTGNNYYFFVSTLAHLNALCDLIDDDSYQYNQMIKDVRRGEKILCYFDDEKIEIPPVKDWPKYTSPANKLRCNDTVYLYNFGPSKRSILF